MIELNGKKFAENEKEFTSSLFNEGGTCVGYAKRTKTMIKIFDHDLVQIGHINAHGCLLRVDQTDNGGNWYSYGEIDLIGEWKSFSGKYEEIDSLAVNITNGKREFKSI